MTISLPRSRVRRDPVRTRRPRLQSRREWWFRSGGSGWDPDLYEWYFTRTPLGAALRARDTELIRGALDAVLLPGHSVLEVGAGTGNYTVWVARRCARVVAVDASTAMVAHLERRLEREGLWNVEIAHGRLPDGLETEERFDGVLCLGVLNYVADLEASVRALAARLAPGGFAIFTVPPRTLEGRVHAAVEAPMRRRVYLRSSSEAIAAAEAAGLEVLSMASAGITKGGITLLLRAVSRHRKTLAGGPR